MNRSLRNNIKRTCFAAGTLLFTPINNYPRQILKSVGDLLFYHLFVELIEPGIFSIGSVYPSSACKVGNCNGCITAQDRLLAQGSYCHPRCCIIRINRRHLSLVKRREVCVQNEPVHSAVATSDAFFQKLLPDRMIPLALELAQVSANTVCLMIFGSQ